VLINLTQKKQSRCPASSTAFYNSICWWYCQLITNCVDPN